MATDFEISTIMNKYNQQIMSFVIIVLMYYIFVVHQKRLDSLERTVVKYHTKLEAMVANPWAARLQTFADSGLTNPYVASWGSITQPGTGANGCPTSAEATEYLSSDVMMDEGFLGYREPPIFYDIGDVENEKAYISGNVSKLGNVLVGNKTVGTGTTYQVAGKDSNGKPIYCPVGQVLNAQNMCYTPKESWRSRNGMVSMNGKPVEGMSDAELLRGGRRR